MFTDPVGRIFILRNSLSIHMFFLWRYDSNLIEQFLKCTCRVYILYNVSNSGWNISATKTEHVYFGEPFSFHMYFYEK